MGMSEERMRILSMVQDGHLTAEDAALLLDAVSKGESLPPETPTAPEPEPRQFRIRVTDLETGRGKADITIPWRLVAVGVRMGAHFGREEINMHDIIEAVKSGASGRVIDVRDEQQKERLEVFVE